MNLKTLEIKIKKFSYHRNCIFKNQRINFYPSNIYLVNGKNGEGKTTLFNIINGKLKFDGHIKINDEIVKNSDCLQNEFISYILQDSLIFDDLSLMDNILLPYANKNENRALELLEKFNFKNRENDKAELLSNGEKELLCFARMLYEDKPIIILDEFNVSLDKANSELLFSILLELKKNHIIIFSSHNKLSDEFIKKCCLINIINHQITKNGSENKTEIDFKTKKYSKFNKLKDVFKMNKLLFKISFVFMLILSSLVIFSGAIYTSLSTSKITSLDSPTHLKQINYDLIKKYAPSYIVKNEDVLNKFEKNTVFNFYNYNLTIDQTIFANGLCSIDDDYNLYDIPLYKIDGLGNYPTNSSEIMISSVSYQKIFNFCKNNFSDKNKTNEYIFNDLKFTYMDLDFKIVGVYKENINEEIKSVAENLKKTYSIINELYCSLCFKSLTVFTKNLNETNQNYLVSNTAYNKSVVNLEDIEYFELTLPSSGIMFSPILLNHKGEYFVEEKVVEILSILNPIFIISGVIFALIYTYLYYLSNKRKVLALRIIKETRKEQITNHLLVNGIWFVLCFVMSFLITSLGVALLETILKQNLILKISNIFILDLKSILYLLSVYVLILVLLFLITIFVLSPKELDKKINEVKEK